MEERIRELLAEGENRQAFNLIVRQYSERLYWVVRRMVTVHDDANDCLQDAFIKIWKNLDKFRGDSSVYTWVYRIAVNETITFLNRRKIIRMFTNPESAKNLVEDPYFNGNEAQTALHAAISKLPPKQKAVFVLRYFDEMPYSQISEIFGTTEGALKATYHNARLKVEADVLKMIEK